MQATQQDQVHEGAGQAGVTVTPQKAASRIKSFFAKKDGGVWQCYACHKEVKTGGNTTNLRSHLVRNHRDYFNETGEIVVDIVHVVPLEGVDASETAPPSTIAVRRHFEGDPSLEATVVEEGGDGTGNQKKNAKARKTPVKRPRKTVDAKPLIQTPTTMFSPFQHMPKFTPAREEQWDLFGKFIASELRELQFGDIQTQVKQNIVLAVFEGQRLREERRAAQAAEASAEAQATSQTIMQASDATVENHDPIG